MTYLPDKPSVISTLNSTSTPLSASATFTGTYEDISDYATVTVHMGAGAPVNCSGSLYFDFSQDGITTDRSVNIPIPDISNKVPASNTFTVATKYFRTRFINSTQAQTTFRLQAIYHKYLNKLPSSRITAAVSQYSDVDNVRAVIAGTDDAGNVRNVNVTSEKHLQVAVHSPVSAFGHVNVAEWIPAVQLDFVYGFNSDTMQSGSFVNGSVTMANNMANVATSTDVGSTAFLRSRRAIRYRTGQGATATWTALFSTPVALGLQIVGPFTTIAGFAVGYNGTDFGLMHRNGGVREIQTLSMSTGTGGSTEQVTITLDSVPFYVTLPANITSTAAANYIASASYYPSTTGSAASGYGWDAQSFNNTVQFVSRRAFNHTGTFRCSGSGTASGSFTETVAGVTQTDTWISQSSWNGDTFDGTGNAANPSGILLNPQLGNVYRVDWQYLGFGKAELFIETPNGEWQTAHILKFANSRSTPTLMSPTAHLNVAVSSQGSTSVISASVASFGGFTHGVVRRLGPKKSVLNGKLSVGTTLTNIVTIRNNFTFKGKNNLSEVFLTFFSAAGDGTKNADFYIITNAALGGTPVWTNIDTDTSCVSYDTSGTTVTGGIQKFAFTLSKAGSQIVDFTDLDSILVPGETITLAAKASQATTDIDMSLAWIEDQ